jgi:hypothetical protein
LKYYVRISRFGKTQYDNPFDFNDVVPMTHYNTPLIPDQRAS